MVVNTLQTITIDTCHNRTFFSSSVFQSIAEVRFIVLSISLLIVFRLNSRELNGKPSHYHFQLFSAANSHSSCRHCKHASFLASSQPFQAENLRDEAFLLSLKAFCGKSPSDDESVGNGTKCHSNLALTTEREERVGNERL